MGKFFGSEMNNIYVTKPYLPPLCEFNAYLEIIWNTGVLTNQGALHRELESSLKKELGCENLTIFNNGTTALIGALDILDICGEVITTPYSFVATSHALIWKKCRPVFVDISNKDCNIDPAKVKEAITKNTVAILAVHCYGFPCDVVALDEIAKLHHVKIIYDAAHAFGVTYEGRSLLTYGDASTLSFHATKVFSTVEGGALIVRDSLQDKKAKKLINFGFVDENRVSDVGLNFKLNELQAAMGLLQLKNLDHIFSQRRRISEKYWAELALIEEIDFPMPRIGSSRNYSYFPVFINSLNKTRDGLYDFLKSNNIFSRKYFFPLINKFEAYSDFSDVHLPVAESISKQVLCLPIYPDLSEEEQDYIVLKIKDFFNS